jgi:hypothetical protein
MEPSELEDAYAGAWQEWSAGDDAALWDSTVAEGPTD